MDTRPRSLTFVAEFPPSTNHYYRRSGYRMHISKRGEEYKNKLLGQISYLGKLYGHLSVKLIFYPPTKAKRDIDNYQKALFDCITAAGIWEDDSQVKHLEIEMRAERRNEVHVQIKEIINRKYTDANKGEGDEV